MTVALTGAPAPAAVDGRPVPHAAVVEVPDGAQIALAAPAVGLRTYLAVRGGIRADRVLGSCSTDTLSGVGPPALEPGDLLDVGPPPATFPTVDAAPVPPPVPGQAVLDVLPGPRTAWVGGLAALTDRDWVLGPDSDRVGLRLDPAGEPVARVAAYRDSELPSEGMVRGAVQLPPAGRPVVFLADHPVTGGYPVVAVLTDAAADVAAQLRPGQPVRLRARG